MTGELRGLLRDELAAERPPPLGDLVATALRDGRRIRRQRRWAALGGGTAVAGVLAVTVALGGSSGLSAGPAPGSDRVVAGDGPAEPGPVFPAVPAAPARTDSVPRAGGAPPWPPVSVPPGRAAAKVVVPGQVRATPEAMLVLLEELLPPGRTSGHARTGPRELRVRLYLDRGEGPGMIRVSVHGNPAPGPRPGTPAVIVDSRPDNCIQRTVVRAEWPDGLVVQADLAGCLARDGRRTEPAPQVLSRDEARVIVTDPRWGPAMDPGLVRAGAEQFPHVASFS